MLAPTAVTRFRPAQRGPFLPHHYPLLLRLCEINSSPAVADHLLPGLVRSLAACAIDPSCAPVASLHKSSAGGGTAEEREAAARQEGFELIFSGRSAAAP